MNYLKKKKKKKSITRFILKRKENSGSRTCYLSYKEVYRIMSDIFRNRLRKYDKVSYIVSGLVNYYRIMNSI